jgi:hypothetical protein
VGVAYWVLGIALDAVLEVVAAGKVGVGGCDVAAATGVSGCDEQGWEFGWSAVGWLGRE